MRQNLGFGGVFCILFAAAGKKYVAEDTPMIISKNPGKLLDKYPARVYLINTPKGYTKNSEVPTMDEKNCCHCSQRKKERSPEEYKKLIHRLNRIEGQIRGIKGMVEKDCYCPDIITQVAAANAALNSFNKVLLAQHIRTCVADGIRNGEDDKVDELVTMLQKLMK